MNLNILSLILNENSFNLNMKITLIFNDEINKQSNNTIYILKLNKEGFFKLKRISFLT